MSVMVGKKFKVYYAVLPSNEITNICGPVRRNEDNSKTKDNVTYIGRMNTKNGFYVRLEASILKNGISNPILVQAGFCNDRTIHYLHNGEQEDPSKILVCERQGGSRLWIAQKYNMDIPCIISDFTGKFADDPRATLLKTKKQILAKFNPKPEIALIKAGKGMYGVIITARAELDHLVELDDPSIPEEYRIVIVPTAGETEERPIEVKNSEENQVVIVPTVDFVGPAKEELLVFPTVD